MSRSVICISLRSVSFPRVSGDEPQIITITSAGMLFSPRERG